MTIIEKKTCRSCNTEFNITSEDLAFYENVSPIIGGNRYPLPVPSACPDCRLQQRLSFRNERNLYKRECSATGKSLISIFSPDKPYKVYSQEEWWSDKWDPLEYGKEFDFSRGFFEQFGELIKNVPMISLIIQNGENSEYTNYTSNHKNCYLTVGGETSQDCMYGNYQFYTDDSMDFYWITNCSGCYDVQKCLDCHNLYHSYDCKNVSESYFCHSCTGCDHCIGCLNLTNKSYHVFNKEATKEEYDELVSKLSEYKYLKDFKAKAAVFFSEGIFRFSDISNSEGCTGDMIVSSKNCVSCFSVDQGENGKEIFMGFGFKDSNDSTLIGFDSTKVSGSIGIMGGTDIYFTAYAWGINNNLTYCMHCYNGCSDLFGCVGLRNKSHCILNKQYSEEEYNELVPKIIEHMKRTGEWGEFFPQSISPFGYNETVACEYFPLSEKDAVGKGLKWSYFENPKPNVSKVIPASKLPDKTEDVPDDILNWAVECEITKRPFRIIKPELEFYKKHNLPLPRLHPDQRHLDRMKTRNPIKLIDRECNRCGIPVKTPYAPGIKVYCEGCYDKEIA